MVFQTAGFLADGMISILFYLIISAALLIADGALVTAAAARALEEMKRNAP